MNKKEFILKLVDIIFTTICFLVIVCICFFGGFAFGLNSKSMDNLSDEVGTSSFSNNIKTADAVSSEYSFEGSNFPVMFSFYEYLGFSHDYNSDYFGSILSSTVAFSEYIPLKFMLNKQLGRVDEGDTNYYVGFEWSLPGVNQTTPIKVANLSTFNQYGSWCFFYDHLGILNPDPLTEVCVFYSFYLDQSFNFNVSRVNIASDLGMGGYGVYATIISFYDNNGAACRFEFVLDKNMRSVQNYLADDRTYYFTNNFSSNEYYQQGYSTGYQTGVTDGENTGYTDGYSKGYDDGLIDGYDNGVVSANDYSFASLLTSVVGAPVTVFIDLLDFNIMGYSLLSIVMGLLTLGLVVLIIKLCLGGK